MQFQNIRQFFEKAGNIFEMFYSLFILQGINLIGNSVCHIFTEVVYVVQVLSNFTLINFLFYTKNLDLTDIHVQKKTERQTEK